MVGECFAPRRDLLLPTVAKVGKSTGKNLRFLHLRARYRAYRFVTACHTFTQNFLFRFVKRIAFAPAPLPLMPTPNNASVSTVAPYERQRRKKKVDASYITISTMYCERVVYGIKFVKGTACRKSRNLGFWLSFWVLLGQWPKVLRPRRDENSSKKGGIPCHTTERSCGRRWPASRRTSSAARRSSPGGETACTRRSPA